ncbi:MAG: hypothetical protein IPI22_03035 [Bacteroidetes bacterium]|nr:hypothetical protein [Bacteroidota bacterium]
MKKIIFIILCVFAFAQSNAQNKIKSYEYWFDNDFMSKVTTNITPVVSYNLNGNIPTTGLPGGLHVFNVRFQDDSAKYSQVSSSFFLNNTRVAVLCKMISWHMNIGSTMIMHPKCRAI